MLKFTPQFSISTYPYNKLARLLCLRTTYSAGLLNKSVIACLGQVDWNNMIYPTAVLLAEVTDDKAFHTATQTFLSKWLCRCASPELLGGHLLDNISRFCNLIVSSCLLCGTIIQPAGLQEMLHKQYALG